MSGHSAELVFHVSIAWHDSLDPQQGEAKIWAYSNPELGVCWASQPVLWDKVAPSPDWDRPPARPEEALAIALYRMGAIPSAEAEAGFIVGIECGHDDGRKTAAQLRIPPGATRQPIAGELAGSGLFN